MKLTCNLCKTTLSDGCDNLRCVVTIVDGFVKFNPAFIKNLEARSMFANRMKEVSAKILPRK